MTSHVFVAALGAFIVVSLGVAARIGGVALWIALRNHSDEERQRE